MKFNPIDIISIQDCLEGYKKLVQAIPAQDELDIILKDERIRIISHLLNKCEDVLRKD